ncbi:MULTISPECIES: ferric iron uptake transcriptional regulator [Shouchella]|uniref:Transcriptional repressor n=1 Tax=Shouchella clausii TaxID=79880 RepID=A0A268P4B9_SHOCL|nr:MULTISPECIES: Fur family transcriptional regulator [Shouchella]MCM3312553.1 transcriptional repressor [Psychrobacillus sp. MER TA 17]KKI85644.1 Fur family transcriptional regulator [Shouchella clausii]MBX0318474.1 transcriptional repressor [Shouchella clausii]MCM3379242.1 transcriptional repressor [Shouchella rhizosphaerae]MDO7283032.1 Fur family transcriptional regulator [Shouchella clausii]
MENRLERIKKQMHAQSYKLTPQREATVMVLLEHEEDHLSAEDVYLLVKEKAPEIGLATVYRTLELLTELNVVDKINFGDGVSRFDLRKEGANHFHHHLVCIECGAVDEITEDLLGDVEAVVERDFSFKIKDHRLTFHGICYRCQEQPSQEQHGQGSKQLNEQM